MSGMTVICENCGAVCNTEDGYCKSCWKKLAGTSNEDDHILEGIGESDWKNFIEKKTDYYMPIFRKHEGKKWFISMNWSAFFLRFNWLFYRRMYKAAALFYVLTIVLFLVISLLFGFTYADELKELQVSVDAYHEYLDKGGDEVRYTPHGVAVTPDIVKKGQRAEWDIQDIKLAITWKTLLCMWILQPLIMGLFGNAIYKSYIKKHIHDPNGGGASLTSLIFGWVVADVIEAFLISPLLVLVIMIVV